MDTQFAINVLDLQVVPTKAQVETAVRSICDIAESGAVDPLRVLGTLTACEKVFSEAKKRIQEIALAEASRYQNGTIELYGAQFQVKEAGVRYDYSDDKEWRDIKEQLDGIAAELKGRETTLRAAGRAVKYASEVVAVTLGK